MALEAGEVVQDKAHAGLDGVHNDGDLYLTCRRLIWVANRLRLPLTMLFGEKQVSLPLEDISACYARGFALFVEAGGRTYQFMLSRWFTPLPAWGLTREWVDAIYLAAVRAVENRDAIEGAGKVGTSGEP